MCRQSDRFCQQTIILGGGCLEGPSNAGALPCSGETKSLGLSIQRDDVTTRATTLYYDRERGGDEDRGTGGAVCHDDNTIF